MEGFLVTEGTLRMIEVIKSTDFCEIIDSDHRGYLVDVYFEIYFGENLTELNQRYQRTLNPKNNHNKKNFEKSAMKFFTH